MEAMAPGFHSFKQTTNWIFLSAINPRKTHLCSCIFIPNNLNNLPCSSSNLNTTKIIYHSNFHIKVPLHLFLPPPLSTSTDIKKKGEKKRTVGTTTGVADKRGKKLCELKNEERDIGPYPCPNPKFNFSGGKGKKSKKPHQRKMAVMMPSPVQKLYDTCKEVFTFGASGIVPSPDNIDKLRAVLDDIKPADLGLHPDMPYIRTTVAGRAPVIGYLHLHECDKFSMGVFCLPPSGVLPLHNHPGMTVFSKLLFGTMHIKSYDWVADDPSNTSTVNNAPKVKQSVQEQDVNPDVRLAKVKVNSDFTAPCNTSILYPADGGNMHCFTALTACAVLDVLGPPYSDPDGRHCQYYYDFPYKKFSVDGVSISEEEQEGYAWLQERENPEDLVVVGDIYRGPEITE